MAAMKELRECIIDICEEVLNDASLIDLSDRESLEEWFDNSNAVSEFVETFERLTANKF